MSSQALTVVQQYEDPQLLETIRDTVCKGATPAQFRMFIEVCKSTGLNPFLKEVYYVPEKGIIMAARDGYLRVANENPQFDGMETLVERDEKKVPIKATCRVWRKDRAHPVTCEAYYSEYKKSSPVWTQYPSAMISKVAEVLALKRSFAINGVVTEEEIGSAEERGSKEAQQDYLRSKGIDPAIPPKHQHHQPPPDVRVAQLADGKRAYDAANDARTASEQHKALIVETAKMLDEPPQLAYDPPVSPKTLEMRRAAQAAEADAVLKQVAKPTRKKPAQGITADQIEIRQGMTNIKDMLRTATGDDTIYYQTLKAYGYESSKDIPTKEIGRTIYKALAELLNRIRDEKKLAIELDHAQNAYGSERFYAVLGAHGCENADDVLNLSSEPLEALRRDLKALGGAA